MMATLAAASCSDGSIPVSGSTGPVESPAPAPVRAAAPEFKRAVGIAETLVVHAAPAPGSAVVARLPRRTPLGSPTVLLARASRSGWVEVDLPIRPNGSSGWVAASRVRLEVVRGRIDVDLTSRRIVVELGGRTLARAPVGIGSPQNPTPTGLFYVTDRVRTDDPNGPYGSFALGLSAHSDTLSEFAGSDGQVGIHGTNDPASIGQAVSHGCVRVPPDVADVLTRVPLGTPVFVH
jgi:lipoprotein-anchoring transpeptidase ErfK/SrfK